MASVSENIAIHTPPTPAAQNNYTPPPSVINFSARHPMTPVWDSISIQTGSTSALTLPDTALENETVDLEESDKMIEKMAEFEAMQKPS